LSLADGVVCDSICQAVGTDSVYAAGDVARWEHPAFGSIRIEHWTNAVEQASAVADSILAPEQAQPYAPLPYFWSDQFDTKIQFAGVKSPAARFELVDGSIESGAFAGVYRVGNQVTGCVGFNRPRIVTSFRRQMLESFRDAAPAA